MNLKDKKVVLIGGGHGMGLATAKIVAAAGAHVIISGRDESKLQQAIDQELNGQGVHYTCDATDLDSLTKMLDDLSPVDHIVITVSSKSVPASSLLATPPKFAQKTFDILWVNYNVIHIAKKFMSRNGSIIMISGSSAKTPGAGWGFWGLLQGSINVLVRHAAIELAPIRVNAVSPGGIGVKPDRQLTEHRAMPEDVGQMIFALISNPAVTGTIVDVDGGERQGQWNG